LAGAAARIVSPQKNLKMQLTKKLINPTLRCMPIETQTAARQRRSKSKPLKTKTPTVQERYNQFFVPTPSPLWREGNDYSLEQPSPIVWVPTVTTYGIDSTLCPVTNAELE
jgi:hypothetical protein